MTDTITVPRELLRQLQSLCMDVRKHSNLRMATLAIPLYDSVQALFDAPAVEPFGYFRAEPFGWTDCAPTDEGAKALYEAPPAQQPAPVQDHSCKFPMCQTEEYQQMLAAQVARDLFGIEPSQQPQRSAGKAGRSAVKLSDDHGIDKISKEFWGDMKGAPLQANRAFFRIIEAFVLKANGVCE